jgi:hypothetical protein
MSLQRLDHFGVKRIPVIQSDLIVLGSPVNPPTVEIDIAPSQTADGTRPMPGVPGEFYETLNLTAFLRLSGNELVILLEREQGSARVLLPRHR